LPPPPKTPLPFKSASSRRGSLVDEPAAYHADNVLYFAPEARFDHLLTLSVRPAAY
jgi:type I restriction enzyme M protein